jgi:hypothetical protein
MWRTSECRCARRGVALLLAIVIVAVVGSVTIVLWRATAAARHREALELADARAAAVADSATVIGAQWIAEGQWRSLLLPGDTALVHQWATSRELATVSVGRLGWSTLVIRGDAEGRSGVRAVVARSGTQLVVPQVAPVRVPASAVTGVRPWLLHPGHQIDVAPAVGVEGRCRDDLLPVATGIQPFPAGVSALDLPVLDTDTVSAPVTGPVRLAGGRVRHPLTVTGMVVLDSVLTLEADLFVSGMLVSRGGVRRNGGRLDVRGGVMAGDSSGMQSELGAGDRVRYDACAMRRAVDQITRPAGVGTWLSGRGR